MNVLLGIVFLIALWYASQRTKGRWIAVIVIGILSWVYSATNPDDSGEMACVGIAAIVMGVFFYFVYSGIQEAEERRKKK